MPGDTGVTLKTPVSLPRFSSASSLHYPYFPFNPRSLELLQIPINLQRLVVPCQGGSHVTPNRSPLEGGRGEAQTQNSKSVEPLTSIFGNIKKKTELIAQIGALK